MAGASILIQPPARAKASKALYPPIIVKQAMKDEPGAQYFATAVLLDDEGAIVDGHLEGTKAAPGFQISGTSTADSGPSIVYAFNNLVITKKGSFTVRLDLYKVHAESPTAGATLVEQLEAHPMTVSDDVEAYQVSSAEQELMRCAKQAGVPLP